MQWAPSSGNLEIWYSNADSWDGIIVAVTKLSTSDSLIIKKRTVINLSYTDPADAMSYTD